MENTTQKFTPMLFSTAMVVSLLLNRKTKTRRLQGLDKFNRNPSLFRYDGTSSFDDQPQFYDHYSELLDSKRNPTEKYERIKARVKPGDIIWVRETFISDYYIDGSAAFKTDISDNTQKYLGLKWKPSLFMPKEVCRLFLKIISVRIEKLCDISADDVRNEGIDFVEGLTRNLYYNYLTDEYGCDELQSFMTLWQKINGVESWEQNPWVWVIEFEKVDRPESFLISK